MKLVLVLALVLISLATATNAYSDGPRSSPADAEATATETASSPPSASSRSARPRPVRFVAADGVELVGRLSGTGDVGVILAHGFSQGQAQDGWLRFVPALVSRGYTVLTFNFRGFCDGARNCSESDRLQLGKNWRDVMAAIAFMEKRGAKKIFLIGASMGGLAVLRAARMPEVDVSGVVSLSTPQWPSKYYTGEPQANDVTPARLRQIDEPKLFVAGTKDVQLPGSAPLRPGISSVRFAADARRMFGAAEEPKELVLVDSVFHSSELVTTAAPADIVRQTRGAVFRFLTENTVKSARGGLAGTLPGDTAVPFWPHETGALMGTSETFVDVRADGSYYDPSLGRRVAGGSESVSVRPDLGGSRRSEPGG